MTVRCNDRQVARDQHAEDVEEGRMLAFLSFVVLLVYALCIATVSSRTADFGPLVPRADSEQEGDWTE